MNKYLLDGPWPVNTSGKSALQALHGDDMHRGDSCCKSSLINTTPVSEIMSNAASPAPVIPSAPAAMPTTEPDCSDEELYDAWVAETASEHIAWLKQHIDPVSLMKIAGDLQAHSKTELAKVISVLGTRKLSKEQYDRHSDASSKPGPKAV